jgi:hypothetical protein
MNLPGGVEKEAKWAGAIAGPLAFRALLFAADSAP